MIGCVYSQSCIVFALTKTKNKNKAQKIAATESQTHKSDPADPQPFECES